MLRLTDNLQPIWGGHNQGTTSSAITSLPIPLNKGRVFSVIAEVGTLTTAHTQTNVNLSLQAATGYAGTPATIASAIEVMASGATLTKMSEVRIGWCGTMTTGVAGDLTIDGVSITPTSAANSTVATAAAYVSSGATVAVLGLETVIPAVCTNLLCTRISTNATVCEVKVYPKDANYTFDAKSSALMQTGGDGPVGLKGGKRIFAYDFKAEDIVAKNASYTHAVVVLYSKGSSTIPMNFTVLAGDQRFKSPSPMFARSQLSTISSAFAT